MPRLRLYDCRVSRLPRLIGLCQGDIDGIAEAVNTAERRLLFCKESGDEGWYGTFAEVRFNGVSRVNPYVTCFRNIARIQAVNICGQPMTPHNQYYEYLDFGNGRMPKLRNCCDKFCVPDVFQRNNAVTFVDLPGTAMFLRAYVTNLADVEAGLRIFFSGTNENDQTIYTQDGTNQVQGQFVTFDSPFATTTEKYNSITGIQKDITAGQIQIFAVDSVTGEETLILTMEPSETVSGYARYFFHNLPRNCCDPALPASDCSPQPCNVLQVDAIVKLQHLDVSLDTDYLLIQNLEAIIEECVAVRLSESDSAKAKQESLLHHQQAVRYLIGELTHYYGKDAPALNFAPFGSARLERLNIAMR